MFKKLMMIMVIMAVCAVVTSPAIATPVDTGSEYLILNDTNSTPEDIMVMNLSATSVNADPWGIGIYEFTTDANGNVTVTDELMVLTSTMSAIFPAANAIFDLIAGTATSDFGTIDVDGTFGIYFEFKQHNWFKSYTHSDLNFNGNDNFEIADVFGMTGYGGAHSFLTHELISIGVNDASPAPVPEPATCLLLGAGLFGMAAVGRKKFNKS